MIKYYGVHRGKVAACSEISLARARLTDSSSAGPLVVDDVRLEESAADVWEISGETTVPARDENRKYSWRCTVTVDVEARAMVADLHTFEGPRQ